VSDMSEGPGWWVASDGKWYPPHLHPSVRPPPPTPPPAAEQWHETIRTFHATQTGSSGSPPPSWFRRHSKAALSALALLLCLVAAVPTAIALSHGTSRPERKTTTSTTLSTASGLPPDTTATTVVGGPAPALTEAEAQEAFDASWPPFAVAFATGDESGIDRYADSDVQDAIAGWFGCGCGPWPTAYQRVYLSAPPETTYPLTFLAEIQERDYAQDPMVVEAVYSQQAAGAPWLISYLISYIDGPPFLDGSEMNTVAPSSTFDISIVAGQFASFFQTVFDTGKPPPHSWPLTGSIGQEEQKVLDDRASVKADHFHEVLSYSAGSHSVAFAIPGGDLMCGEVRTLSVVTLVTGRPIVQPENRSFFGQELAPGTYRSVTSEGIRDACWNVTPTGVATPVSFMGGVYQRVGTPAG
jgi:hypothetical protein